MDVLDSVTFSALLLCFREMHLLLSDAADEGLSIRHRPSLSAPAVNYATFCLLNLSPPEIWQRLRRN